MSIANSRLPLRAASAALALALFAILGFAALSNPSSAFAQGANGQYQPQPPPTPGPPTDPPGGPPRTPPPFGEERPGQGDQRPEAIEFQGGAAPAGAGPAGPSGVADAGQLPFTGFPLFPLLLLIALLLATGLMMRATMAMRARASRSH